jgi:uridine kinase
MKKSIIIGVAGGSGSGKTTFAKRLMQNLGADLCTIIGQDSYYIDQSSKFDRDGGSVNFDHPDAIDFKLLEIHLATLRNGQSIEVPIYDFAQHKRLSKTNLVNPHPVVLVDGILILSQENVRRQFDYSIFIDVPESIRFSRRLKRDVEERGRTPEGVLAQFQSQVKPMHDQFVEPAKVFASNLVTTETFDAELIKFADYVRSLLV